MSTDTSVPRQRDASDSALADLLMLQAPVGFAVFGADLRVRKVNATFAAAAAVARAVPPRDTGVRDPSVFEASPSASHGRPASGADAPDPAAYVGLLPTQIWPEPLGGLAEAALRRVLADGVKLAEPAYPAGATAFWFPIRDAGPGDPGDPAGRLSQPDPLSEPDRVNAAGSGRLDADDIHESQVVAVGLLLLQAGASNPAEEALRRSEERYRSLVQGGAQVVWVAAPDGAMKEDAPEWRWITGQTVEEFLGVGWLDSIHREDRDRVERGWRDCVRTGKTFDDRYRIRTKSGSYRHYDVRAVPIERDGKIVEWVGASTDVTSQREAEEMRGRLTEQLSAAALRTARLQQATSMLAEALTVEQVVEVITEVGRTAIGALRSAVALLGPDNNTLRVVNDDLRNAPDTAEGLLTLESPSVMTKAIAARRPVLVEDPEDLHRQFEGELEIDPRQLQQTSDERSWVGLPLLAAGAPLGALRFSFGRPRRITEEERVFLEALAGQCALAVERAAMYEREHTTAETLQRSLLPDKLPSVPGVQMAARYLPVARNMEIGGDWYDAFWLADRRLAVAVGDVMGKGLIAAAGMGRVRNALRALALTDPRPAAVLGGLDRLFQATELEEQVTTVAYLVIDPEGGEGVLGNAGHLPALVLEPGAEPRFDEVEAGTPLGWASPRKQHPFSLRPGSTAVFYSDGLVENRGRGLDAGLEELAAVAARAEQDVRDQPERLLQYLVDRMLAGHEQDDDVTVLVMHRP
ncbi:MAG TPA: SpoIIE family protein phosphatase [Streptosporangiaceae bacterium]